MHTNEETDSLFFPALIKLQSVDFESAQNFSRALSNVKGLNGKFAKTDTFRGVSISAERNQL